MATPTYEFFTPSPILAGLESAVNSTRLVSEEFQAAEDARNKYNRAADVLEQQGFFGDAEAHRALAQGITPNFSKAIRDKKTSDFGVSKLTDNLLKVFADERRNDALSQRQATQIGAVDRRAEFSAANQRANMMYQREMSAAARDRQNAERLARDEAKATTDGDPYRAGELGKQRRAAEKRASEAEARASGYVGSAPSRLADVPEFPQQGSAPSSSIELLPQIEGGAPFTPDGQPSAAASGDLQAPQGQRSIADREVERRNSRETSGNARLAKKEAAKEDLYYLQRESRTEGRQRDAVVDSRAEAMLSAWGDDPDKARQIIDAAQSFGPVNRDTVLKNLDSMNKIWDQDERRNVAAARSRSSVDTYSNINDAIDARNELEKSLADQGSEAVLGGGPGAYKVTIVRKKPERQYEIISDIDGSVRRYTIVDGNVAWLDPNVTPAGVRNAASGTGQTVLSSPLPAGVAPQTPPDSQQTPVTPQQQAEDEIGKWNKNKR